MTYSIVALDRDTGDLGVGVETHQPSVGAIVPWIKPGLGAVATQSFVNVAFGPQGLALLESGLEPERALAAIIAGDNLPHRRQVAIIDRDGRVAAHTGEGCIPAAGHRMGDGYSVQANMMLRPTVPDAMAEAFEAASGPLAARIFAALEAAQAQGGDIRGSQSAAILVRAPGNGLDFQWDLRVDNDAEPLEKLGELIRIRLAERELRLAKAEGDDPSARLRAAVEAYERAQSFAPGDEQTFWFAVTTLGDEFGEFDQAAALLEPLFRRQPQWLELLHRLPVLERPELRERFPR